MFKYLNKNNIKPTAYCYDGFQVLKQDVPNPDMFIVKINELVADNKVLFVIKPFVDELDCKDIKIPEDLWSEAEYSQLLTTKQKINYFNKYCPKILAMDGFCYLDNDKCIRKIKNSRFHFG